MASERMGFDENGKWVMGGVSNDANLEPRMLRVDPVTNRLLVDANVNVTSDIEIGAVELKNGTDDTRAVISSNGGLYVVGDVASAATDSGNPVKVGGKYNNTLPTLTDGQRGDMQLGSRGALRVAIFQDGSTNSTTNRADNADSVAVSASAVNMGVSSRNTIYNSATTQWDRMPGNTTGLFTIPKPTTSGGYAIYRNLDLQSSGVNIKNAAGQVYGWYIANLASSVRYVKLYNKATAPSVGTDVPVLTIPIPANGAANVEFGTGIPFASGIGIGGVTGVADNNTGAPTANDLIVNVFYN